MKVILKENIENLGRIGDIVKVAPGYARNYLLPKGLAAEANQGNGACKTADGVQEEQGA